MEVIAVILVLLIGVCGQSWIYREKILPYISYTCHFNKAEVYEGESLEIIEEVANPKALFIPCLKSEISTSKYLDFASHISSLNDQHRTVASLFTLKPHEKVTRAWQVKALKRGAYAIEDITIIATDLVNHYKRTAILKVDSKLLVFPKSIDVEAALVAPKYYQGERVVRRFILQDPFAIAGVRAYAPGDSMNQIHWGMTAKQGELMVRQNEATVKQSLTVIMNMQTTPGQVKEVIEKDKVEEGIKIIAGLFEQSLQSGMPVKWMANGALQGETQSVMSKESWGKAHIYELFVQLAKLELFHTMSFINFLEQREAEITTTQVILITCFLDEQIANFIKKKRQQGIEVKVCLLIYDENNPYVEGLEVYYLRQTLEAGEKHE